MEMHQVRYFIAAAQHLNFTRAAEALHVAQPSMTRAIQKLEAELGGPLFRRERTQTHLTELGRMMLPHLKAALDAADSAKHHARRLKKQEIGSLSLGICDDLDPNAAVVMLVQIAKEFVALDVLVEIRARDGVERGLIAGEFDAAILSDTGAPSEGFSFCTMLDEPFVVAFPREHRFSKTRTVALEALDSEPLVERAGCRTEEMIAAAMAARGLMRAIRLRTNDIRCLAGFVHGGLACAVLPESIAGSSSLPYRALDNLPFAHRTVLATAPGRRHSAAITRLIETIKLGAPFELKPLPQTNQCLDENQWVKPMREIGIDIRQDDRSI